MASAKPSPITCHVLDGALGKPGSGVQVMLEELGNDGQQAVVLARGITDDNGRCSTLLDPSTATLKPDGVYKMTFYTKEYFSQAGRPTFYPRVEILFQLAGKPDPHYHIPLLISPYSYSTYRGS